MLGPQVEILEGDARRTLRRRWPEPIDLLFLDGPGGLYVEVLAMLEPELADAAVIVADNAEAPGYRDYLTAQERFVSVPVGSRVEVTLFAS
ncbi:methyltransferase [Amycolatopsis acidicola]|uniref:Methyltransferase n=1 Tax=Amycolatopsis acidicola TaxID=2596893 RepID=A0A5N0V2C9_9PSEU|nr:methyltransferase [Amycolatopsis acidicola]